MVCYHETHTRRDFLSLLGPSALHCNDDIWPSPHLGYDFCLTGEQRVKDSFSLRFKKQQ